MKDFAGKIAFITGGASGAGFGYAQIFSEAGMKVVIADYRQDHLDEAMAYFKEKGAPVHAIQLDVTDRDGYARAADETEKVFGGTPTCRWRCRRRSVCGSVPTPRASATICSSCRLPTV